MRLSIDHQTGFRYASPVKSSYNEARMTPTSDGQTVWSSRITIEPAAWSFSYVDYWGTTVTTFELHEPHERLTVHAQALVDTRSDDLPWDTERRAARNDLGWPALRDRGVIDSMTEFLAVTPRTTPPDELAALAAEVAGQPPRLAGLDVCALVHDRLAYRRGSTAVTSTAREVWQLGSGVCQDFSHVALGALRSIGLPARYVSGYLHPKASAEIGETVAGESHAWVEWWDGEWTGYDPTNGKAVGEQHVAVARGRDYDDVSPLKGMYSGPKSSSLGVIVELTRLA
jgi:transglutaminase-like putative cysteine protease